MRGRTWIAVLVTPVVVSCVDSPTVPLVVGQGSVADAKPFLPAEQQPVVASGPTLAIFPEGSGQVIAQTFTPAANQWLGYIELPVGCSAGVLLNIRIREGLNGRILYEANVSGLPDGIDGTLQLLQVYDPATSHQGIKLHKNREYAFELTAFPGPGATGNTCAIADGPPGNSYPGGRGYFQDPINGPDFLPLPTGHSTDDHDLPFVTLVR
jgi:hypothetical protein